MRVEINKIILVFVLGMLLTVTGTQPVSAIAGFTLSGGTVTTGEGSYDDSFLNFWKNLNIEFVDDGNGRLTGYGDGAASFADPSALTNATTSGQVSGTYDPNTGVLSGEYSINYLSVFHKETSADTDHYEVYRVYQGSYTVQLHPGDTSAEITFKGSMTQEVTGEYPPGWTANGEELNFTMGWGIGVQFTIEGNIEVTAPLEPAVKQELPDSGTRFSDLSGQVEVLFPTGIDENGKYLYDEEAWNFAKLDMVLPEGARIKTQDRSSVILSFADMTTFEQKPETEIILTTPTPGKSQFQLLYGDLMTNAYKMLKDGSMDIEMSQAVAGIKGTILVLADDGATSTLKVIEGTVQFTSRVTGETQLVNAGEQMAADANGLGENQAFDAAAERLNWTSLQAEAEPALQETTAPAEKAELPVMLIAIIGFMVLVGVGLALSRRKKTN